MKKKILLTTWLIALILVSGISASWAANYDFEGIASDDAGEIGVLAKTGQNAFTFQGRLIDANLPGDGLYDFEFNIFDVVVSGSYLGSTVRVDDLDAVDGYFSVELDFGSGIFDGNDRWLEISVREGSLNDPNVYTTLSPRQRITPAPYALFALEGKTLSLPYKGNTDALDMAFSITNTGSVPLATHLGIRGEHQLTGNFGILGASAYGVYGKHDSTGNYGMLGHFDAGVLGKSTSGHAGYFDGQVCIDRGGRQLRLSSAEDEYVEFYKGGSGLAIYMNDGPEVVRIQDDGSVGIGRGDPQAKLDVVGKIRVSNSAGDPLVEIGEGLDYAEGFDVSDRAKIVPGTVLIIDAENPGKLAMSGKAYDNKVAGIVAGARGLGSGVRLGTGQFDCDVALAGRVYCNVDATETAVEPGDLLTTSSIAGYAMKVSEYALAQGAILGKAMESLEKGKKGQILVLVTLQ